tara:strand:+ start:402 stop:548 length:147 start_codon:yes stop_codon:yes gene_type:complete
MVEQVNILVVDLGEQVEVVVQLPLEQMLHHQLLEMVVQEHLMIFQEVQ